MAQKLSRGEKIVLSAHGLKVNPDSEIGLVRSLYPELGKAQKKPKDIYIVEEIILPYVRLGKRIGRHICKGPLHGKWVMRDWVKRAK